MSKLTVAVCLSLSIVAAGMAWIALVQSGSDAGTGQVATPGGSTSAESAGDIRKIVSELEGLNLRVEELEGIAAATSKGGKEAKATPGADDSSLAADIEALAERLESLESDENIAELARSGFARAREKDAEEALATVLDTSRPARERLDAWVSLRKMAGKAKGKGQSGPAEALQSIVDLALDTTLEPKLREDAVMSLRGERSEEVKQPMLNILADDADPQVRRRSLEVLMWHGEDPAVRETITAISREDRHEEVQARATEFMPKVEHWDREAQRQTERQGEGK